MARLLRVVIVVLAAMLGAPGAFAATAPDEILPDPALEARARALGKELRCLVCQNQSIDDSDADLARDLRRVVRERLVAGESDREVKEFLVARYGDFVLLEPPVRPDTWLLWGGPAAVAGLGLLAIALYLRRRRPAEEAAAPLSEAERRKLSRLLDRDGGARS
jgi:cytochrome c-type biogenesis protein CcmH